MNDLPARFQDVTEPLFGRQEMMDRTMLANARTMLLVTASVFCVGTAVGNGVNVSASARSLREPVSASVQAESPDVDREGKGGTTVQLR